MGHVRAGKQVFREEIMEAGFEFEREIELPEFKENYLLIFRKPTKTSSDEELTTKRAKK